MRFRYDNELKIIAAIKEAEDAVLDWKDQEFSGKIKEIIKKIKNELHLKTSFQSSINEILQWRKDLAFIILKIDLKEGGDLFYKYELLVSLEKLMQETFLPFLQLKSSRLRLQKHRFDPVLDINTKEKEIENLPLNDINPMYENALQEIIKNFDFYINAFNLHYPDAFQHWAKNYSSQREIAVFSESLRLAILLDANEKFVSPFSDFATELVNQKLQEWYEGLYEAAKTNNPELIYSDVLHNLMKGVETFARAHYTLKERFATNFAVTIVKSPVKKAIMESWHSDSQKKFDDYFEPIWKSVNKHFNFYQAFLGSGLWQACFLWLRDSKEKLDLLSPLWNAFHEKENNVEIDAQLEPFKKFNQAQIELLFQQMKLAIEKNDPQILKKAFYGGKDKLKYINWQLLDAFYLLAAPKGDVILSQWKKIDLTRSPYHLFKIGLTQDEKQNVSEKVHIKNDL